MLMRALEESDVPGSVIQKVDSFEDAFLLNDQILLLGSDNTPYEERLSILLFDKELKQLDCLELFSAYAPGLYKRLSFTDSTVNFSFWGDSSLQLCVLKSPKRVWKKVNGVHYPKMFQRHSLIIIS